MTRRSRHRRMPRGRQRHVNLTPELVKLLAERFKALGNPNRLGILNALRDGELTVTGLVERTALSQANASRHLQQMHAMGLVLRDRDGLYVRYRLADDDVLRMCELVCGPGLAAVN